MIAEYVKKLKKKEKRNNVNTIDNLPTELTAMWKMLGDSRGHNTTLWKNFFTESLAADEELAK